MRQPAQDDRSRARRLLLVSAALVTGVWLLTPAALPPVYDGLPLPADRYRYLDPPPGVTNPGPPLAAHVTIQLVGGGNPPIDLPTAERPPQAEVELFHGDVDGNRPDVPGVTPAEVRITPVHAPAVPLPAGRQLHGNVYDVSAVAAGVSLELRAGSQAVISLRQPQASAADPRIAVLEHGEWRLLTTRKGDGAGVLSATLPALGSVAVLERTSGFVTTSHHGWSDVLTLLAIAAAAVAIVWGIRRSRRARTKRSALDVVVDAEDRHVEADDH